MSLVKDHTTDERPGPHEWEQPLLLQETGSWLCRRLNQKSLPRPRSLYRVVLLGVGGGGGAATNSATGETVGTLWVAAPGAPGHGGTGP